MTTPDQIATAFTALSHKRRVIIYRVLHDAGAQGLSHGDLQSRTKLTQMTLTHHLNPMIAAGVVKRQVRGVYTYLSLKPEAIFDVIDDLPSNPGQQRAYQHPAGKRPAPP